MDTRFWGPCGWVLLHNITSNKSNKCNIITNNNYKLFFKSIPHILPCVYCRRSLSQYYQELPLTTNIISNREKLDKWLYEIHNKVNYKLRKQGLIDFTNPSYDEVKSKYKGKFKCDIKNCWNFLYSIGMNYPEKEEDISYELKVHYYNFFTYLIYIFPHKKTQVQMEKYNSIFNISIFLNNRELLLKWLYGIEKILDQDCCCFNSRIKRTSKYIAGCKGYNDTKPTCRVEKK